MNSLLFTAGQPCCTPPWKTLGEQSTGQPAAWQGQGPSGARCLQQIPPGQLTSPAPSAPGHHDEESKHLHPARSRPSYAGWWLMCSSLRAAAWTLGVRIKKWISLAVKRSLFMGAGLWIIILCRSLLFSTPTLFFLNKWKHTRRAQCLLSRLLYFTNLFQPPSQLFPCQQLYHCAIPLPTHKGTGWRYELESLR